MDENGIPCGSYKSSIFDFVNDNTGTMSYIASFVAFKFKTKFNNDNLNKITEYDSSREDDSKVNMDMINFLNRGKLTYCSYTMLYLTSKALAIFGALAKTKNEDLLKELFENEHSSTVGCYAIHMFIKYCVDKHQTGKFQSIFNVEGGEEALRLLHRTCFNIGLDNLTSLLRRNAITDDLVTLSMLKDITKSNHIQDNATKTVNYGEIERKRWELLELQTSKKGDTTLPDGWRNYKSEDLKKLCNKHQMQITAPNKAAYINRLELLVKLQESNLAIFVEYDRNKRIKEMTKLGIPCGSGNTQEEDLFNLYHVLVTEAPRGFLNNIKDTVQTDPGFDKVPEVLVESEDGDIIFESLLEEELVVNEEEQK